MNVYNLTVDALSCLYLKMGVTVKGIVHPKIKILSFIYSLSSSSKPVWMSAEHKVRYSE